MAYEKIQQERDRRRQQYKRKKKELEDKKAREKEIQQQVYDSSVHDPNFNIPEDIKLSDEYVNSVNHNRFFNDVYSEYYMRLYEETNLQRYKNLSSNVHFCHRYWYGDRYYFWEIFDLHRVNLCHDKFCVNCQHLKQAFRLKRFTPVFDQLREKYDLYHLVLTCPNVPGSKLNDTLNKVFEAFKKLIRYFSGDAKIKGVDFARYGFVGAIRCLEIVANPLDYHPHIHCAILLAKDLRIHKYIINKFSYSNGVLVRWFSDLEVLIQKIFWLCMNDRKVTLDNIQALPLGYSCTLDEVEGDSWHEVFKYVMKLTKDGEPCLTYEQFKTLHNALDRRRVMQGYGILFNIAEDDSLDEEVVSEYAKIIAQFRLIEDPDENFYYEVDELVSSVRNKKLTVISKRLVQKWLNDLAKDEQQ